MRRADTLVLCYHAVGDVAAGAFVSARLFEQQLTLLVERGYRSATFSEAVLGPSTGSRVAVTFDDGHESVLTEALPILERLGLVGTVFPRLDDDGTARLETRDLRRLLDAGWEVGSHSLTHPSLPTLDDETLMMELRESKRRLESELGIRCTSLSYPYGAADARVVAATDRAGYDAAAALLGVPMRPGRLAWPRVGIDGRDGPFAFRVRVSRPMRALQRSYAGAAIRGVLHAGAVVERALRASNSR